MNTCRLSIRAVPNAPKDAIVGWVGESLKVRIHAPALEGRANAALCAFLSRKLGVSRSAVSLEHGARARTKVLEVRGYPLRSPRPAGGVAGRPAAYGSLAWTSLLA